RSQDEGRPECTCSLRGCRNPFDGQAFIVKGTILIGSRILDRASNESYLGRKPNSFRHDFRCIPKAISQVCRDGQVRSIDNQTAVLQRLISRQPMISSTKRRSSGGARCRQCLEAKAGKNSGGADIPRVRNDEGARAVVKCEEASRLFVLGGIHRMTSLSKLQILPLQVDVMSAVRGSA